jgi:hypothetical protein
VTCETLSDRELWTTLGISRAKFYALKREGYFDSLKTPVPHRYSREKVQRFIHGPQWSSTLRKVG